MVVNWDDECIKALIASRVFGLNIEYRMCERDYEYGYWLEIQSMYGPEAQAQWLKDAAEGNFPAEHDDFSDAGMIREACVSRRHAVKLCRLDGIGWKLIPDYPNDIAAACQVVDWMIERGWVVSMESDGHNWCVMVHDPAWEHNTPDGSSRRCLADVWHKPAPRAICEAALEAVEKPENPW